MQMQIGVGRDTKKDKAREGKKDKGGLQMGPRLRLPFAGELHSSSQLSTVKASGHEKIWVG